MRIEHAGTLPPAARRARVARRCTACKLALTTRALDLLKRGDGADFLRAARAIALIFPPVQQIENVLDRIPDLPDLSDDQLERMRAIRDEEIVN